MAISRVKHQALKGFKRQLRLRTATLVLFGTVMLAAGVCAAWFAREGSIDRIFAQLHWLRDFPPLWVGVPMLAMQYLLAPTVILWLVSLVVMQYLQNRAVSRGRL